jgi:phosphatidylglycerophosphate synthase
MPEPFTSWATDHPIYNYITKPIAYSSCFIHPNVITLFGAIVIIPITLNILRNGSRLGLVSWMVFRSLLDCLDGSIARACNKVTKFGSLFDIICDTLFVLSLTLAIIYVMIKYKLFGVPQYVLVFLLIMYCLFALYEIYVELTNDTKRFENYYVKIVHDNTILISALGALALNAFFKVPLGKPL